MMTRSSFPKQTTPAMRRPKKGKKAGKGYTGAPPARARRQPC